MNSNSNETILASIDDKIEDLYEAIIQLKRQRNSHAPISRLPPEVLSAIFLYNVVDGSHDFGFIFTSGSRKGWISITYVCHYWREVALQSASLWSCWGVLSPRWSEIFCSRSQQAPLRIRASIPWESSVLKTFVELLRKSDCLSSRIRELHLSGHAASLTDILQGLFPDPTSINDTSESPIQSVMLFPRISLRLPATFLSHRFPNLWRLRLLGCSFDWNSTVFKSAHLTHLSVNPVQNPTMTCILSILAQQPLLEEFCFANFNLLSSEDFIAEAIDLPHLRSVDLDGSALSCFKLMTKLSYPRNQIKIRLAILADVGFTAYMVLFLSRHYGDNGKGDSIPILEELSIKASFPTEITCRPPSESSDHDLAVPEPSFHLKIKEYTLQMETNELIKAVCTALPLRDVRKAVFNGLNLLSEEWRSHIFSTMGNLEELEVSETCCSHAAIVTLTPGRIINRTECDSSVDHELEDIGRGDIIDKLCLQERMLPFCTSPAERRAKTLDHESVASCEIVYPIPVPKLKKLRIINANLYAPDLRTGRRFAESLAICLKARKEANGELSLLSLHSSWVLDADQLEPYVEVVKEVKLEKLVGFADRLSEQDNYDDYEDYDDFDGFDSDFLTYDGHDPDSPPFF